MLSKKLRNKLITILLTSIITFTGVFSVAKAYSGEFKLSDTSIIYDYTIKHSKQKILIYHSHTCEKNIDSSVVDIGNDLAKKLEKKGYIVEHIKTDFSKDYNNSYFASEEMLNTKDLSSYALILDIHIDSAESSSAINVNTKNVAKCMFVQTKTNTYLDQENDIVEKIQDNLINKNISKGVHAYYQKGISWYNLNKSPNMLLLEAGNNMDTYDSCRSMNTYLADAINTYLNNK